MRRLPADSRGDISFRARDVKLLLLDVDGVLTDGSIIYNDRGEEIKSFHVRDGLGIRLLQRFGIEVAILTSRISEALMHRCRDLKIEMVIQGMRPKLRAYEWLLAQRDLTDKELAYIGDDWVDIPILRRVGLAVAVRNAEEEVLSCAHCVTALEGGRGAVREVCDIILKAKNLKEEALLLCL
ncbi:MAG: HAD-IIIA family hydrolase [Pseudomonadota bacterium]